MAILHNAVFGIVNLVYLGVLLFLWIRLRNVFPIRGRGVVHTYILTICATISLVNIVIDSFVTSCSVFDVIYGLTCVGCVMTYCHHAVVLLFKLNIAKNISNLGALFGVRVANQQDIGWHLRHRIWITAPYLTRLVAVEVAVVVLLLGLSFAVPGGDWIWGSCSMEDGLRPVTLVTNLLLFVYAMGAFCVGFLFRSFARDGMQVKLELSVMGGIMAVSLLCYVSLIYLFPNIPHLGSTVTLGVFFLAMFPSFVVPLVIAYRPNVILDVDLTNLRATLNNRYGRQCFLEFLAYELSSENLLFWEAVNVYKKESANSTYLSLKESAHGILNKFITLESRYCVNIPHKAKKHIETVLASDVGQEELLKVFDQAQAATWKLMLTDTFPRFRASPLKKAFETKLKDGLADHEEITGASKGSQFIELVSHPASQDRSTSTSSRRWGGRSSTNVGNMCAGLAAANVAPLEYTRVLQTPTSDCREAVGQKSPPVVSEPEEEMVGSSDVETV